MAKVFIGTSGFSYPHWGNGVFYPQGLTQAKWFDFYVKHFNTVELNVSFYRLLKKETFAKWQAKAGKNFVFSIKGWRWITHIRKLKNCQAELDKFFEAVDGLRISVDPRFDPRRSAVILWQLPPSLKLNLSRFKKFIALLPAQYRHAFEFRHESWMSKDTLTILLSSNIVAIFQDYPEWPRPQAAWPNEGITGNFVYLRLHGKEKLYTSGYSAEELRQWAQKIKKWLARGLDVYVYFNNDALGYAVENAKELKKLVLH